jgi:biopolymer transport protein TolQ
LELFPLVTQLTTASAGTEMGIVAMVLKSGPVVKLVLLLLLALSVFTWTIILQKWRRLVRVDRQTRLFHEVYQSGQKGSAVFEQTQECVEAPVARLFHAGFEESRRGAGGDESEGSARIQRVLTRCLEVEMAYLQRGLPFLATVGATAPFIGLFGTVWGIMNAFRAIGLVGSASLASVAPGISEALVTTAAGLAAAIPAVVAYNYFVQRLRQVDNDARSFAADFLSLAERHLRKQQGQ